MQYGHDVDLMAIFQLLRARAQNLTTDPTGLGTAQAGMFWYNTSDAALKIWTGTAVINTRDVAQSVGNLPVGRVTGAAATGTTRLNEFTTAPNGAVPFGGQKATGLADGTAASDAATKGQVDAAMALASSAAQGIAIKAPVRAVDTVGVTQTGAQTVDSVPLAVGDRYLRAVGSAALNGIWVVQSGAHVRAQDADGSNELAPGTQVIVTDGALAGSSGGNADTVWRVVSDVAITPGTTAQTWERLPGTTGEVGVGGAGLTKTGQTYDVGAGDGIVVDADAVRVNPNRVSRKRAFTIPTATGTVTCTDGSTMSVSVTGASIGVTHNLAAPTAKPHVIYGSSPGSGNTQGAPMLPDFVNSTDGNTTTITLPTAPQANQYLCEIDG